MSEYKYVLGLDPGGTTGVAMLRYTDDTLPELIYLHQIENGHRGYWGWFAGARPSEDLAIASEKWVEHNKKGVDREPLVIEGIQYTLWQDDITYQEPKMKSLIPDSFLKEQNLWTPGRRHQMDALIHALVYLRNEVEHQPTLEALAGRRDEEKIAEEGEAENAQIDSQDGQMGGMDPEDIEAVKEFMKAVQEAAEAASEDSEELAEAVDGLEAAIGDEYGDGEPTGSGPQGGYQDYEDDGSIPEGKRKRRERNGAFAGFDPSDGDEEILFDGKI